MCCDLIITDFIFMWLGECVVSIEYVLLLKHLLDYDFQFFYFIRWTLIQFYMLCCNRRTMSGSESDEDELVLLVCLMDSFVRKICR